MCSTGVSEVESVVYYYSFLQTTAYCLLYVESWLLIYYNCYKYLSVEEKQK